MTPHKRPAIDKGGHAAAPEMPRPPPTQPQFEHIQRYWDREHQCFAAKLLPGEYYVTTLGERISTVLGSCVSACVRDPRLGIGGMNHFMLPLDASNGASAWGAAASAATRYGNVAMERLINEILKLGGRRDSLEFKLVGGGKVLDGIAIDIGARNIEFVRKYVDDEGFEVAGEDLGDIYPRKVHYAPDSGKMRVKKLKTLRNDTVYQRERHYLEVLDREPIGNEIELF
ncbi:MAG TPA: chemoreceptor glutamine deamidase CheD [Steroidobacteraceae bacterium]